jgi:hypothetical protein
MSGQRAVISQYAPAANAAVMGNMRIGHQQIVIANDCLGAAVFGARVKRAILADNIIITNLQENFFAFKFKILRLAADYRSGEYPAIFSDGSIAVNYTMCTDLGIGPDCNLVADYAIWTDGNCLG